MLPSGGDDLNNVDGVLYLTFAEGSEPFTPFNSDSIEYTTKGEIIYKDASKVLCRRWNWRQGNQTKITTSTTNVAINIDCLPPISIQEAEETTKELANLVKEFCSGQVIEFMLDSDHKEAEIKIAP